MNSLVTKEISDGVALLTLNRPERHNAWTFEMEAELFGLLHDAENDPEIRVVVITGAGKSFCPGLDAQALSEISASGRSTQPHLRTPMTYPTTIAKPIIAAINGACAGIGLILALQCDIRFASTQAKFTTSFAQRGIMAEHGIAWSLSRAVGPAVAFDLLYSARVVLGDEAAQLGLINRAVEPDELLSTAMDYARGLAANSSPAAMGTIKRQVYEALESTHEEARVLALRHWMGHLRFHSDFKEGISSFMEKRPPAFAPWDPATPAVPPPLPQD
ncbi:enoyl-CoA hydratase/isomerase family protein [Nocardia sp. BSTN01]|uniref:enoyl-CoA hydratase-related protein n=1 Tax=Nocardia sp. BSTN01 TaxID=2783665 RepID=UPI0018904C7D|nr:enoyl-CoA hydratase-related protein [Nocardia sp. BSTN01]MBF4997291.1 enoyl-CoA hydratase/isomerase family protein [Nocardia sp. BSTN01]